MANPFEVQVPNVNSALQTLMQGYQFGSQATKEASRRNALSQLMGGGAGADFNAVATQLARSGDLEGASQVATVGKALAAPETTDELKEYNKSVQQGYKGSFIDWKTAIKRAGATNVNVNTGEKSYDTAVGKAYGDQFIDLQKQGRNALGQRATLDQMEQIISDPNFYSGKGAETFALPLKQAVSRFGGDPNAAAPMEAFRALSSKAVLDTMGGSLGTGFSNADRDFVVSQTANLGNTPEGNRAMIQTAKKVNQRTQEISKRARDYVAKKGRLDAGFDAELADWADKNPLFPQAKNNGSKTSTGVQWQVVPQ